jgi:hypothetical protein
VAPSAADEEIGEQDPHLGPPPRRPGEALP